MAHRYYTLYRPPSPGAVPKGFTDANVFGERTYIKEIGHAAWGTVDYKEPLSQKDISDYELAPANEILNNIETT